VSAAADNVLASLRVNWSVEHRKLVDAVNYAAVTKTGLPDHYWQAEHEARLRMTVAAVLAQELHDLP
jgi:hypothetical protein